VDNIEVGLQAVRLYELWVDAPVGEHLSILAGLYDLNSEFYATESAGLLIAPPFGIGSELASTGVNGPSIFPSTALALRVNLTGEAGYVRAAALNARASVPGDPDGVDTDFEDGALVIAEAGRRSGAGSLALGLWRYSHEQDDLRDLTPGGDPVQRTAQGAYLLAERVMLGDDDGRKVTGFVRLGVSDRRTSPFSGGWQAGVLVERVFAGRPDSALSVGLQQGLLSSRGQDLIAAGGVDPADAESGIEITYSDRLTDRVTLQPDLQVIFDPGGDRAADPRVVFGLRLTIDLLP
ncbi:MAG: carbohydrate porin, partial [Brevundimonas sp.]